MKHARLFARGAWLWLKMVLRGLVVSVPLVLGVAALVVLLVFVPIALLLDASPVGFLDFISWTASVFFLLAFSWLLVRDKERSRYDRTTGSYPTLHDETRYAVALMRGSDPRAKPTLEGADRPH